MVTDTSAHHLLNRENIESEGKFAFTTDKDDIFEICFISRVPSNVRGSRHSVALDMKMGVEAKNYEQLGDAAKLKPLEVDLKRLEDLSESIVQDFAFMRRREVGGNKERGVKPIIYVIGGDERHQREYQQSRPLLLHILHVLSSRSGDLAGQFMLHNLFLSQVHCRFSTSENISNPRNLLSRTTARGKNNRLKC